MVIEGSTTVRGYDMRELVPEMGANTTNSIYLVSRISEEKYIPIVVHPSAYLTQGLSQMLTEASEESLLFLCGNREASRLTGRIAEMLNEDDSNIGGTVRRAVEEFLENSEKR